MRRPYMSLVSRTTKITTIVIVLDVIAMVVCAVFVPPEQVRESLILTTVAFILLVAFLLYSLLWDAELASAYFEQLTIAQEKTAAEGAVVVVEGSENSSEQTVASRVVGITGVRLLDEESPWVIRTVEPWLRQDGGVLPPDPVVLRVRKTPFHPYASFFDSLDEFGSMSTNDSTSTTSMSATSSPTAFLTTSSVTATTTAAGSPGILAGNGTCALNVEEDSARFGKVVWTNCCTRENLALNCPPQGRNFTTCPGNYLNCADPIGHAEMCSVAPELFAYSDAKSLNKKCCPKNFSCGLNWESPCELVPGATNVTFPPYINPEKVITNALYLSVNGIFAGCNDLNKLSPGAVGGIVAVAILGICISCVTVMCCIRRRLYRDPAQRHRAKAQKMVSDRRGRARNLEITITRGYQVEERGRNNDSRITLPVLPALPFSARWMGLVATAQPNTV